MEQPTALTVTVWAAEQPLASVTTTEKLPGARPEMLFVVAPFDHE